MYPAAFEYYRAESLADAQRLLGQHRGAKLLAGGHSLIPLLKLRLAAPPAVIDVGRVSELKGIAATADGVRIGALTTHAELAASPPVRKACAALADAAGLVGDPAVRNRGTIGGNVAHADPASDLPTVLAAAGARFITVGPRGERTIDAHDFFQGLMATALADDEVLVAITVPAGSPGQGAAYVKFAHPASRYAVVGVAAILTLSEGQCRAARVALGGLTPRPTRAASVETALVGKTLLPAAITGAAAEVSRDLDEVLGDVFASADYRRAVAPVYVTRAVTQAMERAH